MKPLEKSPRRPETPTSQLTTQLRYEPTLGRNELRIALAIQQRLLRMALLLSSLKGRLTALEPEERLALLPTLANARKFLEDGCAGDPQIANEIRDLRLGDGSDHHWKRLVREDLAMVLGDVLRTWSDIRALEAALKNGRMQDLKVAENIRRARAFPLAPDWDHALRMGAGILVGYVSLSALWYATGWAQAPDAILLGSVALGFFGGGDEPGNAIARFGRFFAMSFMAAGVLSYGLLPFAGDFWSFVVMMGIFMLPLGMWAMVNPLATLLLALSIGSINLQAHYAPPDVAVFIESKLASLMSIFVAFLGASLFRTWGTQHQIDRYLQMEFLDIDRLSRKANPRLRDAYVVRALNRISLVSTRVAATGQTEMSADLLAQTRAGFNIADARITGGDLAPKAKAAIEPVFDRIRTESRERKFSPELLCLIDTALDEILADGPSEAGRGSAMRAVARLRVALFEHAPAWRPAV